MGRPRRIRCRRSHDARPPRTKRIHEIMSRGAHAATRGQEKTSLRSHTRRRPRLETLDAHASRALRTANSSSRSPVISSRMGDGTRSCTGATLVLLSIGATRRSVFALIVSSGAKIVGVGAIVGLVLSVRAGFGLRGPSLASRRSIRSPVRLSPRSYSPWRWLRARFRHDAPHGWTRRSRCGMSDGGSRT